MDPTFIPHSPYMHEINRNEGAQQNTSPTCMTVLTIMFDIIFCLPPIRICEQLAVEYPSGLPDTDRVKSLLILHLFTFYRKLKLLLCTKKRNPYRAGFVSLATIVCSITYKYSIHLYSHTSRRTMGSKLNGINEEHDCPAVEIRLDLVPFPS